MDVDELRELRPLGGLSEAGLARVAACGAELETGVGQVIARTDDPGSGMLRERARRLVEARSP